jgi:hypothetical protein
MSVKRWRSERDGQSRFAIEILLLCYQGEVVPEGIKRLEIFGVELLCIESGFCWWMSLGVVRLVYSYY